MTKKRSRHKNWEPAILFWTALVKFMSTIQYLNMFLLNIDHLKKNRKFGLFFYLFSGLPTLPPIFLLFRIQQTAIANSKFHKIQLTEKQKNRKSYFKF